MSDSCHFHGSFMALSHTSLTWVQSAKIYWKSYPKSLCWLSICFFCLIPASFLAICQIHVGFMALSWHFHGAFFLLIFIVFPNSFMALACQIHGRFMSDSSGIHRGFMPVSFSPKKSKSCQIHVTFMAVSWQFHGTFTYKPYLGTACQNLLEKVIQKVGVGCRFGFFCLISASFLAICQIHLGFMALSWHFHGTFFLLIFIVFSWKKSKPTTESISKMTV